MKSALRPLLAAALAASTAALAHDARVLSDQEKLSYALGMGQAAVLQHYGLKIDLEMYSQAFKDVLSGRKTALTVEEARLLRTSLQAELRERKATVGENATEKLAAKNAAAGEAFLAANKAREGVVALESGLQYKVLKAGEGNKPTSDDTVAVHYRAKLVDGKYFASTANKQQAPAIMPVHKLIPGWREAMQLMPVGSRWEIVIPPQLAYGERALGRKVGPNSTLIFEVELMSIIDAQNRQDEANLIKPVSFKDADQPMKRKKSKRKGGPR
jgi:FKBP-type peptidyl-prolyl cis-trans isomerase